MLKESLRELELRLRRETEFNNGDNRLNTEYLLNVLKKFLLSDVASERAKLVVVICSMLHMRPEEMRTIEGKWAEKKPTGGLVGWFTGGAPSRPAASTAGSSSSGLIEYEATDEISYKGDQSEGRPADHIVE